MEIDTIIPLLMFVALFGFILLGVPVAFALAGTGLIFALIGHSLDLFLLTDFGFIPSKIFGIIQNFTLVAVPLFICMGVTLHHSGISEELLEGMESLFSKVHGGIGIAVVIVGALLAASTGIVGATVVTMGVIALPGMLKRSYDPSFASGTIAASGTLGQIIPPSIVLVLLGDMMNVAVADLFAGAVIPGLILVLMYSLYVATRSALNPALVGENSSQSEAPHIKKLIFALVPTLLLILLVLGSILAGAASPTESAACGAVGAIILALVKRKLTFEKLRATLKQTCSMTAMVFTLLAGAQFFSVVFRGMYGDEIIVDFITGLNASPTVVLISIMFLIFLLGFILDFIEICFIVIPIITPLLVTELGFNSLWLAIIIAVNLQTSFLTPPFGFALFYLKGVAPPEIQTSHIYRGIIPFVCIQILVIVLLFIFPSLCTWLPGLLF